MLDGENFSFINIRPVSLNKLLITSCRITSELICSKKKKKPQIKQHLKKKKREKRKTFCYITDKSVLVTAQNKKHLDQKKH